ncbi:MAG: hypothetical protein ABI868_01470 [Acidobacteriota bacterium]
MNQGTFGWMVLGIVTLVLSAGALLFGVSLLPPAATMQGKLGTIAPLIITWGMIWLTVVSGVGLAIYIFAYGAGKVNN